MKKVTNVSNEVINISEIEEAPKMVQDTKGKKMKKATNVSNVSNVSNEVINISEVENAISGHVIAVGGHFGLLKKAVRNIIMGDISRELIQVLCFTISERYKKAYEEHNISTFNKYSSYYKRVELLHDIEVEKSFIDKLPDDLSFSSMKEVDFIAMLPKIRKEGGGAKKKITINDKLQKAEAEAEALRQKVAEAEALRLEKEEAEAKKEALKEEQKALKAKQEEQKKEEARLASLSPKDRKKEEALKAKKEAEALKKEEALKKQEVQDVLSIVARLRYMADDEIILKVTKMDFESLKSLNVILSYFK